MNALQLAGPRLVLPTELEEPRPADGEVLVQVEACGICGSDLGPYRVGKLSRAYFGHEFCGRVVAVGPGVEGLAPGTRVASGLVAACGACEACRLGRPNFCEHAQSTMRPGGFAELCAVSWSRRCRALAVVPEGMDPSIASLHEPVSCVLRIVERAGATRGGSVLVLGLGIMGFVSGLLLKSADPSVRLVGVDGNARRTSLAVEEGFDHVASPREWRSQRSAAKPGGFDVVIDATGVAAAFSEAVAAARLGGTVVLAGVPEGETAFEPLPIFRKELTIVGAKGPYPVLAADGTSEAMALLRGGRLRWDRFVRRYAPGDAAEAFRDADAGLALRSVIVFAEPRG